MASQAAIVHGYLTSFHGVLCLLCTAERSAGPEGASGGQGGFWS